jgi:hypothetical protein
LSPSLSSLLLLSSFSSFNHVPFIPVSKSVALPAARNVLRQLTYFTKIKHGSNGKYKMRRNLYRALGCGSVLR